MTSCTLHSSSLYNLIFKWKMKKTWSAIPIVRGQVDFGFPLGMSKKHPLPFLLILIVSGLKSYNFHVDDKKYDSEHFRGRCGGWGGGWGGGGEEQSVRRSNRVLISSRRTCVDSRVGVTNHVTYQWPSCSCHVTTRLAPLLFVILTRGLFFCFV